MLNLRENSKINHSNCVVIVSVMFAEDLEESAEKSKIVTNNDQKRQKCNEIVIPQVENP